MINAIVSSYGGEEWDWAGDGGIYAFHLEKIDEPSIENGVYSAKRILDTLDSFNQSPHNKLSFKGERYHIRLRMGIDTGRAVYHEDPGERRSQALNYAVKIQKRSAPNSILITHDVFKELSDEAKSRFRETGITFKGKTIYIYPADIELREKEELTSEYFAKVKKERLEEREKEFGEAQFIRPNLFIRQKREMPRGEYPPRSEPVYEYKPIDMEELVNLKRAAIVADSGMGKTTLLKELLFMIADDQISTDLIPVYFHLRDLSDLC
jgi:hypothetical protein